MVNTRKNSCGNIRTGSLANGKRVRRPERAPGPGLKPQDNNASFEGISEAEYNKRHMKALKDADPGVKLSSTQVFEPTYAVRKPTSNGLKLQARGHKLQDPVTRVQAHKLRVRGTSNKDK